MHVCACMYVSLCVCVHVCVSLCVWEHADTAVWEDGSGGVVGTCEGFLLTGPHGLGLRKFPAFDRNKTEAVPGLRCFLGNPKTLLGEGMVGTREKQVIWLHHQLHPPPPPQHIPTKIAQDKMWNSPNILLGKQAGGQATVRVQIRGALLPGQDPRSAFREVCLSWSPVSLVD